MQIVPVILFCYYCSIPFARLTLSFMHSIQTETHCCPEVLSSSTPFTIFVSIAQTHTHSLLVYMQRAFEHFFLSFLFIFCWCCCGCCCWLDSIPIFSQCLFDILSISTLVLWVPSVYNMHNYNFPTLLFILYGCAFVDLLCVCVFLGVFLGYYTYLEPKEQKLGTSIICIPLLSFLMHSIPLNFLFSLSLPLAPPLSFSLFCWLLSLSAPLTPSMFSVYFISFVSPLAGNVCRVHLCLLYVFCVYVAHITEYITFVPCHFVLLDMSHTHRKRMQWNTCRLTIFRIFQYLVESHRTTVSDAVSSKIPKVK